MVVVILGFVIVAQAVERFFFAREMNQRVSEAVRAIMSRNINEFISATQADKPSKTNFTQSDEIELNEANDEDFDKHIKQAIKQV